MINIHSNASSKKIGTLRIPKDLLDEPPRKSKQFKRSKKTTALMEKKVVPASLALPATKNLNSNQTTLQKHSLDMVNMGKIILATYHIGFIKAPVLIIIPTPQKSCQ